MRMYVYVCTCACQGQAIKPQTPRTVNQNFYYWPILRRNAMRFRWAKTKNNPTAQFFSVVVAVFNFGHSIKENVIFKSGQILILSTPMCRNQKLPWKHPQSLFFLLAHLAVRLIADLMMWNMPKSDRQKKIYELCRPKIQLFTYRNREFHFCSDFNSERANRREDIKSGANLPLDKKVGFSQNWVSWVGLLPIQLFVPRECRGGWSMRVHGRSAWGQSMCW